VGKNRKTKSKKTKSAQNIVVKELKQTIERRPMKLRFSPTAWAKLLYLRDIGDTEVGGFALTQEDDLLYVSDFLMPKQECGSVSVEFDDESIADMTDDLIDLGYHPKQFMRIWIHTHPNISASPSKTDEDTFDEVFSGCDWAVMFILSKSDDISCRLRVNSGPFPGDFEIPTEVDYSSYEFPSSNYKAWAEEYEEKVTMVTYSYANYRGGHMNNRNYGFSYDDWAEYYAEHHLDNYNSDDVDNKIIIPDLEINSIRVNKNHLSIPEELLQYLSPNELTLMESMNRYEREFILRELQEKYGI